LFVSLFLFFGSDVIANLLFHKSYYSSYIQYVSFVLVLFAITCVNEQTFRGMKQILLFAFFQRTAKMLIAVILFIVFYYFLNIKDNVAVYSYMVGLVLIFIASTYILFNKLKSGKAKDLFPSSYILRSSIPMMMSSSVLLLMSWTDTLMIGSFLGEFEVGVYNVAIKVALLTSFTLNAINSISAPKLSETYNSNNMIEFNTVVTQTTKTIFYSTLPMIGLIFFFPDFLLNFFGKEFLIAKSTLLILAFSQVINSMSGSVGIILNMTGKEKVFRNILFFALAINIVLNLFLIPIYGIEGAAIASASSLIYWNLYSVYYVYKEYNVLTFISFLK